MSEENIIRKTPQELLELAEEDDLFDIDDEEFRLAFLLTIGIFEDGPDVTKVIKWLNDSSYPLEEGYEKKLHEFMANLYKSKTIVEGKITVSEDPPSGIDLVMTMLAARGFIERCEPKETE